MDSLLLTDEEIGTTKAEAVRLSWTHKAHPRYEKEKYLLTAQLKKVVEWLDERNLARNHPNCFMIALEDWQALLKEVK